MLLGDALLMRELHLFKGVLFMYKGHRPCLSVCSLPMPWCHSLMTLADSCIVQGVLDDAIRPWRRTYCVRNICDSAYIRHAPQAFA